MGTFAEDLDFDAVNVFSDVGGGFAVEATTSGAQTIPGIFYDDYQAATPGADLVVSSSETVFRIASALATGLSRGNLLTISGIGYTILEARPMARAFVDFKLQEV